MLIEFGFVFGCIDVIKFYALRRIKSTKREFCGNGFSTVRIVKRLKNGKLHMNRVVICMILAAFIYTVVAIIVFVRVGAEPSTLTENVFRFLSVEGGAMALIKSVKTVTKKDTGKQHENEPDDINADNNEEVQG